MTPSWPKDATLGALPPGLPRMQAHCEQPRCEDISGKRPEMGRSNRPARNLSSAPELLGVLDSAEAPKSPGTSTTSPTGVPMCQQPQCLHLVRVGRIQKGSAVGDRGNAKSATKRRIWAFGPEKILGRSHRGVVAS